MPTRMDSSIRTPKAGDQVTVDTFRQILVENCESSPLSRGKILTQEADWTTRIHNAFLVDLDKSVSDYLRSYAITVVETFKKSDRSKKEAARLLHSVQQERLKQMAVSTNLPDNDAEDEDGEIKACHRNFPEDVWANIIESTSHWEDLKGRVQALADNNAIFDTFMHMLVDAVETRALENSIPSDRTAPWHDRIRSINFGLLWTHRLLTEVAPLIGETVSGFEKTDKSEKEARRVVQDFKNNFGQMIERLVKNAARPKELKVTTYSF